MGHNINCARISAKVDFMSSQWMPQINRVKCTGCGDCIDQCPTGALGWSMGKAALIHPDLCTYCAVCEDVCPAGAIELPYLIVKREKLEGKQ